MKSPETLIEAAIQKVCRLSKDLTALKNSVRNSGKISEVEASSFGQLISELRSIGTNELIPAFKRL